MKIYLLRHAKAQPGFPDCGRQLAPEGRIHARKLGEFLKQTGRFEPGEIWCSPLVRAQQTLELVLDSLGLSLPVREQELLEPEMDPAQFLPQFDFVTKDLLVVGHNPNLETLASLLLGAERQRVRVHMKTCTMLCLDYDPVPNFGHTGTCELLWMFDPRLLDGESPDALT